MTFLSAPSRGNRAAIRSALTSSPAANRSRNCCSLVVTRSPPVRSRADTARLDTLTADHREGEDDLPYFTGIVAAVTERLDVRRLKGE